MIPNDHTVPVHTGRVLTEPWRTAAADTLHSHTGERARLSRTGRNPATARPPLASRLHRAEGLLSLTVPPPTAETETARRKKLSFSPGIARDALAGRRTVLCDPTAATPAGGTEVVRLGRPDAEPEPEASTG